MRQQINLYLSEYHVKKDPLTVALMARIIGIGVVLMMLLSGFDYLKQYRLQRELDVLRAQLADETRKTTEIDQILARRSQNQELDESLEIAEQTLRASRDIRAFFSQTTLGNVNGFSEYFKDLSRASMDGLWLTGISLGNGGETVELKGQVVNSALVPRFVTNINQGQSPLTTKKFSVATNRTDTKKQQFSFTLSTTR